MKIKPELRPGSYLHETYSHLAAVFNCGIDDVSKNVSGVIKCSRLTKFSCLEALCLCSPSAVIFGMSLADTGALIALVSTSFVDEYNPTLKNINRAGRDCGIGIKHWMVKFVYDRSYKFDDINDFLTSMDFLNAKSVPILSPRNIFSQGWKTFDAMSSISQKEFVNMKDRILMGTNEFDPQ